MNFLEALKKMGLSVADLQRVLQHVADGGTDLAPVAVTLLEKLGASVPLEHLADLGAAIPGELLNSVQGKFDGRFHPGGAG